MVSYTGGCMPPCCKDKVSSNFRITPIHTQAVCNSLRSYRLFEGAQADVSEPEKFERAGLCRAWD